MNISHDFGTYYDVVIVYDDEEEGSEAYMLKVESELPCNWDEESRKKLKENEYPLGEYNGELR